MRAYARVLRVPRMRALLASSVLTRMPIGINGLAVVLFLRAVPRRPLWSRSPRSPVPHCRRRRR